MAIVTAELIASDKKTITKDEIERMIEIHAGIHGTTVPRRAHTIMTWFRWIGEEVGVFFADSDLLKLRITSGSSQ